MKYPVKLLVLACSLLFAFSCTNQLGPSKTISVSLIEVTPNSLALEKGKTGIVTAKVSPADATNKEVAWTSSDAAVATVSSSGIVTAVAKGSANVTATTKDGGHSAFCKVTVSDSTPIAVTGITLSPSSLDLSAGGPSYSITATVSPSDATDKTLSWVSSDPSVATVSSDGRVSALALGTATITAKTADGAFSAQATVTVKTVTIGKDTTWSGTVALAVGTIIPSGVTLTIQPGTIISCASGVTLTLDCGTINAVGTASNPIVFKSAAASPKMNDWTGIIVRGNSKAANFLMKYCLIKHASFGVMASSSYAGSIEVGNCCFIDDAAGICLYAKANALDYLTFDSCFSGITAYAASNDVLYSVFVNNSINGVEVGDEDAQLNVNYSNFISNSAWDLYIYNYHSSGSYIINTNYCYPETLKQYAYDLGYSGCKFNVVSGQSTQNATAGCGFSYSSL